MGIRSDQPTLPGSEEYRLWAAEARAKYTRPKNTDPSRSVQLAQGVWQDALDDFLPNVVAIQLEVCEEMIASIRAAIEMGRSADEAVEQASRSGALKFVQAFQSDAVGETFDDDPERVAAERAAVMLRRAARCRKAGRVRDAEHWELVADAVRVGGLVPDGGVQRVGDDRLRKFVEKVVGGKAS